MSSFPIETMHTKNDLLTKLKIDSRNLQWQILKCEKEEEQHRLNAKKAIQKRDYARAHIEVENAARRRTEKNNYNRLFAAVDATMARLEVQSKMVQVLGKPRGSETDSIFNLSSHLAKLKAHVTSNLQKMPCGNRPEVSVGLSQADAYEILENEAQKLDKELRRRLAKLKAPC
ncbi:hypothetical protein LUZ61_011828 [Rhynchospora tenuis]|uniref:Uncharacterized protein n=1 Tax=Rhynchospora tenuis TaxID=198213 RepID=A0AAD6A1X9_9POAL|nr:hypothetical protein LUZ61_011828 [Rhynchospora tenuis]